MTSPSPYSLANRVALVTGSSQGIGRAIALTLAQAGAHVALAARNEAKLAEVAAEIAAAGGTAHLFPLDIADETSIKSVAKAVPPTSASSKSSSTTPASHEIPSPFA